MSGVANPLLFAYGPATNLAPTQKTFTPPSSALDGRRVTIHSAVTNVAVSRGVFATTGLNQIRSLFDVGSGAGAGVHPSITLTANRTTAVVGQSVLLTWSTSNATTAFGIGAGFAGTKSLNGSQNVVLSTSGTIVLYLVASDSVVQAVSSVSIDVSPMTNIASVQIDAVKNGAGIQRKIAIIDPATGKVYALVNPPAGSSATVQLPTTNPVIACGFPSSDGEVGKSVIVMPTQNT